MHRFPFGTFALNPTGHKSLRPLRIAVLFPEFLGDYMMLVPFLYALKSCSDGGWVDLYTTPTVSKIARFHPSLREVVSLSDWNDSAAQSVLVAQLKGRYDAVYFTNDHLFWLAVKSKIPLKIKARYTPLFKLFCKGSSASDLHCSMMHTSERHIHNLRHAFGRVFDPEQFVLNPGIPDNLLEEASKKFGIKGVYGVVAVDNHSCKRFDRSFFVKSIQLLVDTLGQVVLVGLKDPHQSGDAFIQDSRVINGVGKTGITDLFCLIQRAALLIGTDSGPSHIAAAMGTKSVVMFPPKGASPQLSGGFHPDSYSYKLSPFESGCSLRCSHYPSCPQLLCETDYRWPEIETLVRHALASPPRTWAQKNQETYRLSMPVWIIGNSDVAKQDALHFKKQGFFVSYWNLLQRYDERRREDNSGQPVLLGV